ncbi:nucleoside deaminase [Nocardiopsis sp. FIRDI 009]|uniref:nucleoside deaminase n=1 Tax=Nocardiopsis sp. FIRDI 009 TaxID=714197 RepID=UPI0018E55FC4|nr:nucleoside deaminase [Nocardiopsis sp. FIRDI 009]
MNRTTAGLAGLMAEAVEFGVRHVASGGLPFVGVLTDGDGYVSDFGVNEVRRTGDATAHAEIVAMRRAMHDRRARDVRGLRLLATGEPCGLCYRFAIDHRIARIHVAVDADTAAAHGFDYRHSYPAFGVDRARLAGLVSPLPVARGLEPFERFHRPHHSAPTPPAPPEHTKGTPS